MSAQMVDIYINDEKLTILQNKFEKMEEMILTVSQQMSSLAGEIANSNTWKGNGAESCEGLVELLASFSANIAGTASDITGTGGLSGKSVTGGGEHMQALVKSIDEFEQKSITFEKGGSAACVMKLNSIQG